MRAFIWKQCHTEVLYNNNNEDECVRPRIILKGRVCIMWMFVSECLCVVIVRSSRSSSGSSSSRGVNILLLLFLSRTD